MEEKMLKEAPFKPLSVEEQKKLMVENTQLKMYNQRMGEALQKYQTGEIFKRIDWLFKVAENAQMVFSEEAQKKAVEEIESVLFPKVEVKEETPDGTAE